MNDQNVQKGNTFLIIAIIVGIVAIGAVGFASWKYFGNGYYGIKENQSDMLLTSKEKSKTTNETTDPSSEVLTKEDWKTYDSSSAAEISDEMYIIKYPNDWSHKEERAIGTHSLVTFFTDSQKQKKISVTVETTATFISPDATQIIIKDKTFYKLKKGMNYIYKLPSGNLIEFTGWVDENILKNILESFTYQEIGNEISDWKTYQNKKYGFEIKYPGDWNYLLNDYENQQLISFYYGKWGGEGESVLTVSWGISFQERYETMKKYFEKEYDVTESIVNIDNVKGKLLTIKSLGYSKSVFFEKNGYIYNLAMISEKENLFYQMLSTFKFTE